MSDLLRTNLSPSRPFVKVENLNEDRWSPRWDFDILSWVVEIELQKKDNKKSWLFACGLEYASGSTGWPRYQALQVPFSNPLHVLKRVRKWLERGPYNIAGNEALGQLMTGICWHIEYIAEEEANIFGLRHMEQMIQDGLDWLERIPTKVKRVTATKKRMERSNSIYSFRAHVVNCEGAELTYFAAAYDSVEHLWWGRYHTEDEVVVWEAPQPPMHASDFLGLTLR